jgi:hypothetical protein
MIEAFDIKQKSQHFASLKCHYLWLVLDAGCTVTWWMQEVISFWRPSSRSSNTWMLPKRTVLVCEICGYYSGVFWDVAPCWLADKYRRFTGAQCVYRYARKECFAFAFIFVLGRSSLPLPSRFEGAQYLPEIRSPSPLWENQMFVHSYILLKWAGILYNVCLL